MDLGSFVLAKHVERAQQLLGAQLKSRSLTHRSLDLEILRRQPANALALAPDDFHAQFLRNDSYLNYAETFAVRKYLVPKGTTGTREFHFSEEHAMLLHYAIGFYLLELVEPIRERSRPHLAKKSIHTYYGARINLESPGKSKIYYQDDYQDFTKRIRRTVLRDVAHGPVSVIRLDIQDFFGSIDHLRLLEEIGKQALPSSVASLKYSSAAKQAIRDAWYFLLRRRQGLPLSKHNIVSNAIADLFL